MITLKQASRTLANNQIEYSYCILEIGNNIEIELPNEILFYIELQDKILVLINWYQAQKLYDIGRNIFCYDKKTGKQLWQVEEPKFPSGKPMDTMYVDMGILIQQTDGSFSPEGELSPGDKSPYWIKYLANP